MCLPQYKDVRQQQKLLQFVRKLDIFDRLKRKYRPNTTVLERYVFEILEDESRGRLEPLEFTGSKMMMMMMMIILIMMIIMVS